MFGLFRKGQAAATGPQKLPRPQNMPDDVGRTLVVDHKQEPNWVWSLKAAVKPGEEKGTFFVRIFDERAASARGIQVKDYNSFNERPELILFDGWFNKKTHAAQLKSYQKAA